LYIQYTITMYIYMYNVYIVRQNGKRHKRTLFDLKGPEMTVHNTATKFI